MKRILPHPLPDTPQSLMTKAGYIQHCVEDGRPCYHRRLNDPPFPRFHVYISMTPHGMEIDLHFDALDSIHHQGNHAESWAYEGGRVNEEMHRMVEAMCGRICLKQIYHPSDLPSPKILDAPRKKRGIFNLLFK